MRLAGKVAIVTGAGSGIGKATVELFRGEGATVIGADLKGADVECDAGEDASVKALIDKVIAARGRLDIVFANAGISGGLASIFDQTVDDWTKILRVNAICPGLIETGMTEFLYERARATGQGEKIGHLNPLRRGGVPAEIANAALFLASDESSYVNGHALVVDGGLSSSLPFNSQHYGRTAI